MPRPGKQTTERAKDFKGTLRQLLSALRQYKLSLIVVMVFAILSTIFNIAGPKILAKATTALATGWIAKLRGIGSIDFAYIGKILLTLLAMYLCSAAFSFIQGWLMTGLSQKVCYDFRRQISEKINRLPLAYFEKRTVGEVLSRITNDVDTLGQSLNQSVTQLITSITTMIGVLIMMLSISPKMTLIALLILPVSLVLVMLVVRFSQKYFKAQQATLGVVNGQVEEVYSGHNVIKAFNREAAVLEDFNAANDKLFESAWHHHHRRYPGFYPVCPQFHPAHPAAGTGVQHAAEHGRRCRARVRVPERARRGSAGRPCPPSRPCLHRWSGHL